MKNITSIRQIGSNKYVLIIDEKKHIVYDDVLLQYNLLKKGEISDEIYNKIINTNNYYESYNKILKYITIKLRTEKEIIIKLNKLNVNKKDQDKIILRLKQEGYLNDQNYVRCFVNDNVNLTLNGPSKIFVELKKLGFKDDLISEYIAGIDNDIWLEKVQKIINKKIKSNHNLSTKAFKLKLKKDLNKMGYDEKYYQSYIDDITIDDSQFILKDYQKIYQKLSRKYDGSKLEMMVKQKLYQLGYNIDQITEIINSEE